MNGIWKDVEEVISLEIDNRELHALCLGRVLPLRASLISSTMSLFTQGAYIIDMHKKEITLYTRCICIWIFNQEKN